MLGNIPGISSGIAGTAIYQAVYHGIGFQGAFVHGFSWLNSLLPGLGRWVKTMMYHGSKGGDELPWADMLGQTPGYRAFDPYQFLRRCLIWLRNVMATEWDYFSDFMGSISSIDIWVCSKTVGPVLPSNTIVRKAIMNLACLWYRIYPSWYGDTQSCAWPATALLHHWPLAGRGAQVGTWIGPRSKEPQIGLSVGSSNGLWQEGLTRMRMGRRSILWPASSLSPSAPS